MEGIAKAKAKGNYLGRTKGSVEDITTFISKKSTQAILKYLKQNESIRRTAKLSGASVGKVQKVKQYVNQGLIEV